MRLFLCSRHYPLSCRGAVGHITGDISPKADGVIFVYDFSNTPTATFFVAVKFLSWGISMRILIILLVMLIVVPAHSAETCDAGYYLNDAGECEICPAGYFCSDGGQTLCPENFRGGKVGATSVAECMASYVEPGYYLYMHGYGVYGGVVQICPAGYYCPGGYFDASYGDNISGEFGQYSCGFGYTDGTGADSIDDCIPCPEIGDDFYGARMRAGLGGENVEACNVVYFFTNTADLSDLGDAAIFVFAIAFGGGSIEENPNWKSGEAGGHVVVASYNPDTHRYTFAGFNGTCPVGKYATPGSVYNEQSLGIAGDSVPAVLDGLCMSSEDISDGMICGDFDGSGQLACMACSEGFGTPLFQHSDGTRTEITDCYILTKPGYFIETNIDTYEIYESECRAGDYCPGGVVVRYDMETGSISGGNASCSDLGVWAMSDVGASSQEMCYVPCTDEGDVPTVENGTMIADDRAFYPNKCGYSVQCNDGYSKFNDVCYGGCGAGISKLNVGGGVTLPLFADRITSPSLNVMYNNQVCYIPLTKGKGQNTVHVMSPDGTVYHVE